MAMLNRKLLNYQRLMWLKQSSTTQNFMVYTSLYMFILPVMVKLGMAYYCFTKFTHINLICRSPFVVLKADGQTVEGGQYFVTSRHLQNQSLKTLMCLRNSFLGVFTSK